MSVLPGEGSHVILYGSTTFAARTRTHSGYLARPDLAGSYPVAAILGPVTAGVKELCRQLARHGVAAVALEERGAVADLMKWISAPGTPWADASRVGAIFAGSGQPDSATPGLARAVVLLDAPPTDSGGRPTLGLYGSDGDPASEARRATAAVPDSRWVFYTDAPVGFWDLGDDGYRPAAAADAVARIVAFFAESLSAPEAA